MQPSAADAAAVDEAVAAGGSGFESPFVMSVCRVFSMVSCARLRAVQTTFIGLRVEHLIHIRKLIE